MHCHRDHFTGIPEQVRRRLGSAICQKLSPPENAAVDRVIDFGEPVRSEKTLQTGIGIGASQRVNIPFDRGVPPLTGITLDKFPQRRKDSLSAALDVCEIDRQRIVVAVELREHFSGADVERYRPTECQQRILIIA